MESENSTSTNKDIPYAFIAIKASELGVYPYHASKTLTELISILRGRTKPSQLKSIMAIFDYPLDMWCDGKDAKRYRDVPKSIFACDGIDVFRAERVIIKRERECYHNSPKITKVKFKPAIRMLDFDDGEENP